MVGAQAGLVFGFGRSFDSQDQPTGTEGGRPVGGQDGSGLLVKGIGHPGGQPGAGLHDHFVTVGHQVGYRIGGAGHPPFAARPLQYNCDAHASPASGVLPRDPAARDSGESIGWGPGSGSAAASSMSLGFEH